MSFSLIALIRFNIATSERTHSGQSRFPQKANFILWLININKYDFIILDFLRFSRQTLKREQEKNQLSLLWIISFILCMKCNKWLSFALWFLCYFIRIVSWLCWRILLARASSLPSDQTQEVVGLCHVSFFPPAHHHQHRIPCSHLPYLKQKWRR